MRPQAAPYPRPSATRLLPADPDQPPSAPKRQPAEMNPQHLAPTRPQAEASAQPWGPTRPQAAISAQPWELMLAQTNRQVRSSTVTIRSATLCRRLPRINSLYGLLAGSASSIRAARPRSPSKGGPAPAVGSRTGH